MPAIKKERKKVVVNKILLHELVSDLKDSSLAVIALCKNCGSPRSREGCNGLFYWDKPEELLVVDQFDLDQSLSKVELAVKMLRRYGK